MKDSKLNIHYMYLLPAILLQIITTLFMVTIMDVETYGAYTLYLTTINFLYAFTLGIPEGYIIYNRGKDKSKISGVNDTIKSFFVIQLILVVVAVLCVKLLDINSMYVYAILTSITFSIYHLTQSIYRTLNEAHTQNIFILLSRLIFLIDGVFFLQFKNIEALFISDIVMRTVLSSISVILVNHRYKDNPKERVPITKYLKLGIPIMVSGTVFNLTLMVDKYALADDLEKLGIYSLAITVVLLIRVILKPLNQVIFVNIDENMDLYKVINKFILFIIGIYILLVPAFFFGQYLINHIEALSKYEEAIPIIGITMMMIPLMIPLESVITNISKLKDSRVFTIRSILVAIIYVIVLYSAQYVLNVSLIIYALLVVVCYLIGFIIHSVGVISKRDFKIVPIYLICSIIYVAIILTVA